MWGWLDSVVNGLKSVWEGIQSLPSLIANAISYLFDNVVNAITNVWNAIKDLGTTILDGIKAIFIPDTAVIRTNFDNMVATIKTKLGFNTGDLYALENIGSEPITDTKGSYSIAGVGTFNLTFLDTSFLKKGIEYFRPLLRGFIVLLLLLYNYKQILTLIGQDPNISHQAQSNYEKWKEGKE